MIETENQLIERLDNEAKGLAVLEPKKEEPVKVQEPKTQPIKPKELGVYQLPLRTGKSGKEGDAPAIIGGYVPEDIKLNWNHSHGHKGLDLQSYPKAPVYSPGPGIVKEVGKSEVSGNFIKIQFEPDNNLTSFLCHFDSVVAKIGDKVDQNTLIAYNGDTGRGAQGTWHVHVEFKLNGSYIDPNSIFGKPIGSFQKPTEPKTAAESLSLQFLKILDNDLLF